MVLNYNTAKEKLLTNFNEDCRQFFVKNGCILETGYCYLLNVDLEQAKNNFKLIKDSDIRAHWALFLISLIEGDVREYPTYFELRNFLEIDLNILINHYKGNYIEKIIRYSDFMFSINPEIYKFIGRVFYNTGFEEQAMYFLNAAKNCFYNDPELHYLFAFIYFYENDYKSAKKSLDDCLRILPQYFPAVNLKRRVELIDNH